MAGFRSYRRHRAWTGIHLSSIHADQVVPRPPRYGDGDGHHGFWRRRHDRRTAGRSTDEILCHANRRWRLGNFPDIGSHIFHIHDGRRIWLPRAARGLETCRLESARDQWKQDDHLSPRTRRPSGEDAAILVHLGSADAECFGRHRLDRDGLATIAGGIRRQINRHRGDLQRIGRGAKGADSRHSCGFHWPIITIQHRRAICLGFSF